MASTSRSQTDIPELDLVAIAKTTRKTLDRLASFSNMQSASDPLPLLTKISNKILSLIQLIDTSMIVSQHGYRLATDGAIMCDPQETDWDADINLDSLRRTCASGFEESKKVVAGFIDVKQEIYKIAASTKDNMFVVLVPPDVLQAETMKIHLKDIGADLVANLNLLSDFSRTANEVSNWWECVKEELDSPNPRLVPTSSTSPGEAMILFERWSAWKNSFQQYYNIVHIAHERYPNLLSSSSTAWKSIAAPRSVSPTSIGHEKEHLMAIPVGTKKSKGIKLLFGIYTRKQGPNKGKEKGKEKQIESTTISPPGEHEIPSDSNTVQQSTSSRSRNNDKTENCIIPVSSKTNSSFSCFSIGQFGDGMCNLGKYANGFKMC